MTANSLDLKKVAVHNLKNVSLSLAHNQLIVFTGVSGSGKSSLAFDTIYVEGQRRYIESLSAYARRFLGEMPKPNAQSIDGVTPTIAIEQKSAGKNPRSSVGTMTSIYDYLRVLYARLAYAYCPISKERVTPISRKQIAESILSKEHGTKIILLAPFAKGKKGEFKEDFIDLLKKGFARIRIDGNFYHLAEEIPTLDKNVSHDIELVIDRLTIDPENRIRFLEAIEMGLEAGNGILLAFYPDLKTEELFSEHGFSEKSGLYYPPLEPEDFSFNHPKGMCEACEGLGVALTYDLNKIIDPTLSIAQDCCIIAGSYQTVKWGNVYDNLARIYKFSVNTPFENLSEKAKKVFLYGTGEKWTRMRFVHPISNKKWTDYVSWKGVIHEAKTRFSEAKSEKYREKMRTLMSEDICMKCHGSRIKAYPAAAKFKGKLIYELTEMMIEDLFNFFTNIELTEYETQISEELLREISGRLQFLLNVGLHYLTLSRTAPTLSGGESQRVRLASQIGYGLVGVTYVLDEPSIGLHPRDNTLLIKTLISLKDRGNTVIVVEHDEETICAADTIVDIGPGAGVEGGEIITCGSLKTLLSESKSITGAYLKKEKSIPVRKNRRKAKKDKIIIKNATHHNLKNIDVEIPLGIMVAITGVSGSGKSSLISDILYPAFANKFHKAKLKIGKHSSITGFENLDKIIAIDQSPIGRTPRSNPATYVKVFDNIRDLFASLPMSLAAGFQVGRFSFNVKEGSCYHCKGMGMNRIDMDFMEDEWVVCPHCKGKRFDTKTLSITYRDKNIHDILEMSIEEAYDFFQDIVPIAKKLKFLIQVGLGYLKLGQGATTLSGGEAQRIKLSKELMRPQTGKTLYILDEPTTGLHFHDIYKLNEILQSLVDTGNSVILVEHNMDLIKTVDYIIDLGPEGGFSGGQVVGKGTPEEIKKHNTPTGIYLKKAFDENLILTKKTFLPKSQTHTNIVVKGASQNNLKDISLTIPRNKMSVFTGPSGSGKTSLAFETIYAEGQRRYIDSLSPYAKTFVKQMPKPKIEEIDGLSPSICIEQKKHSGNPRSTLGTMTEIYDFLRVVYARIGTPFCPETGEKIQAITVDFIIDKLFLLPENTKIQILAPMNIKRGDDFSIWKNQIQNQGFLRIRLNHSYFELDDEINYDNRLKNTLELVVDRLIIKKEVKKRLHDAIVMGAKLGNQSIIIATPDEDFYFNLAFAVLSTGKSYPPITHHTFSFNSQEGMCHDCLGLGYRWGAHLENDATVCKFTPFDLFTRLLKGLSTIPSFKCLEKFLKSEGIDPHTAIKKLSNEKKQILFNGSSKPVQFKNLTFEYLGINNTLARLSKSAKGHIKENIIPILSQSVCSSCNGTRLNALAQNVRIDGISITDLCNMPISEAKHFVETLKGTKVLQEALTTLKSRLSFLIDIGLDYLSLDRPAPTLSGGEVQRTRLARQLGSGLTNVLYVLDEPTIGLHPHNNTLLNTALKNLKELNNTLILVEHDPLTTIESDMIYDFGPESGNRGGFITAQGTPQEIQKNDKSLTGRYLSGKLQIPILKKRRKLKNFIKIENATKHNIKNLSLSLPTKALVCITGVSGSGKSTLLSDILLPALKQNLAKRKPKSEFIFDGTTFKGLDSFDKVLAIDQTPIGRTIRSDVVTYTDLLTPLRYFFASIPSASAKGLMPRHFSFNHNAGLCKKCRGLGFQTVELQFLPSVRVECDACKGNRLNPLSLSITYKGKNLGQILKLTIKEAKEFLPPIPKVMKTLDRLISVGLDYLTLGQETQTLSGGEASRIKLSRELAKPTRAHTLYIFDEPTVGLHSDDIAKILPIFHSLVDKGNTLIIIEHNLDIIKNADHILDLGPEGGLGGGKLIAAGTPEDIARSPLSHTATYLANALNSSIS